MKINDYLSQADIAHVSDYRAVVYELDRQGQFVNPRFAVTKHGDMNSVLSEVQKALRYLNRRETYGLLVQDLDPEQDESSSIVATHRVRFTPEEVELPA